MAIPSHDAVEARDAQLLQMAHPEFHQWRADGGGTTRCGFDGCTAVSPRGNVATAGATAFAVLNVATKLVAAGPFDTVEDARDVKNTLRRSNGYTYAVVGPLDRNTWRRQANTVIPPDAGACARAQDAGADRDVLAGMEEMLLRH